MYILMFLRVEVAVEVVDDLIALIDVVIVVVILWHLAEVKQAHEDADHKWYECVFLELGVDRHEFDCEHRYGAETFFNGFLQLVLDDVFVE
jgi:hypothetical protein